MTVDQFIAFFNGIYCDYDGAYGDQCFDLANGYSRWIGGQRFTGATADLIYNQPGDFYTAIKNIEGDMSNFPQKGDIVVWDWPHVGIATGNNTNGNQFEVIEQNDPTNSDCHLKTYNYAGVIGWLRPKQLPQDNSDLQAQLDAKRLECDTNWNMVVAICNALGVQLDPNDKEGSKQKAVKAVNDFKQQYDADTNTIIGLKKQLEENNKEDKEYAQETLDAQHATQDVISDRKTMYDQLDVTNTKDALSAIVALQKPHEELVQNVQPTLDAMAEVALKKTRSPQVKTFIQKVKEFFGWE